MLIELSHLDSPVGPVVIAVAAEGLCALDFTDSELPVRKRLARAHPEATFGTGARAKKAATLTSEVPNSPSCPQRSSEPATRTPPSGNTFTAAIDPEPNAWAIAATARP